MKRAIKWKLYFVKAFSVPIKREVVSLCYTTSETQFSSFDQNLFQTATSVNQLVFSGILMLAFESLIFFLKDFSTSLLHKLTSESFMVDFAVSILEGKQRNEL